MGIIHQWINEFNVLMFIAIVIFNSYLSSKSTAKEVDKMGNQLYLEIEELKDEIRGNKK